MNTIEYQASDPSDAIQKNSTEEECLSEEGWCPVSSSYPINRVEQAVAKCPKVVEAFKVVITKDLDLLGDNSPSVISSEKDLHRPWSWKVRFQLHLIHLLFHLVSGVCVQEAAGVFERGEVRGAWTSPGHRGNLEGDRPKLKQQESDHPDFCSGHLHSSRLALPGSR